MTCGDVEILICDYLDGTLEADRRAELERHLEGCGACAELANDAAEAAAFVERAAAIEPPPELVNRILFDAPWARRKSKPRQWLDLLLSPIRQPRYAMSMAMTIVSFAMLARFTVPIRNIHPDDLRPAAVWTGLEGRAYRVWGRALKFYDNLKVVYEIQATLKQWQQRTEDQAATGADISGESGAASGSRQTTDDRRLPVHPLPQQQTEPGGAPVESSPEKR